MDSDAVAAAVAEADKLYEDGKTEEVFVYLQQFKDSEHVELLWRACRATVDKGKLVGKDPGKKELYYEALGIVQRALELDPENFGTNEWYGIVLSYIGDYEGTNKKIANSFIIKKHFDKAHELKPEDATALYLIGEWCYAIADLPWWQRKIAGVVFTAPPESTYEEALEKFQKAESLTPGFYSGNRLMLARCLLKLGRKEEARPHAQAAYDAPAIAPDDIEMQKQAAKMLKDL